jgi:hypothetical protein
LKSFAGRSWCVISIWPSRIDNASFIGAIELRPCDDPKSAMRATAGFVAATARQAFSQSGKPSSLAARCGAEWRL